MVKGDFSYVLNSHGFSDSGAFRICAGILVSYVFFFFLRYDRNPEKVRYGYLPITNNKRDWRCKDIPEVKDHSSNVFQCSVYSFVYVQTDVLYSKFFNCWSYPGGKFVSHPWMRTEGRVMGFLPNVCTWRSLYSESFCLLQSLWMKNSMGINLMGSFLWNHLLKYK